MAKRSREDEMIPFPSEKRPRHYDTDLGDMPALVRETIAEFSDIREMFRLALAYEWNQPEVVQAYCRKFGNTLVRLDPGYTYNNEYFPSENPRMVNKEIMVRGRAWLPYMELFKRCIKKLEIIYSPNQNINDDVNQYVARNCAERLVTVVLSGWNSQRCSMLSFVCNVFSNVTDLELIEARWTLQDFELLPTYFPNVTHLKLVETMLDSNIYDIFFERLQHLAVWLRGDIGFVAPIWKRNEGLRTLQTNHNNYSHEFVFGSFRDMISNNPMIETLIVSRDKRPMAIDEVDQFIQEHPALVKLHFTPWEIDYVMASKIMTRLKRLREFKYRVIQPDGKEDIERVMWAMGWRVTEYNQDFGFITLERTQE